MPDLVEQMYCAEQIHIPPTFPYILKQYAKAAIRTQPYDLLRWSAAYFRAMANGDEPPVKVRLEYPPLELPSGLTPGYLKVLLKQFKDQKIIHEDLLYDRWKGMCLDENGLTEMLNAANFDEEFEFMQFFAVAAGYLTSSLSQTMVLLCELLTEEPEGGSAMIPCDVFNDLYTFLARLECGPPLPPPDETVLGEEEQKGEEVEEEEEKEEIPGEEERMEGPDEVREHAVAILDEIVEQSTISPTDRVSAILDDVVRRSVVDPIEPVTDIIEEIVERSTITATEPLAIIEEMLERVRNEPAASIVEDLIDRARYEPAISIVDEIVRRSTVSPKDEVASLLEEILDRVPIKEDPEFLAYIARKKQRQLRTPAEVAGIGPVVDDEQIESVIAYMKYWAVRQEGMVMPRNVRHFLCPRLDPIGTVLTLEEAEK